eukprot:EG_transcript_19254
MFEKFEVALVTVTLIFFIHGAVSTNSQNVELSQAIRTQIQTLSSLWHEDKHTSGPQALGEPRSHHQISSITSHQGGPILKTHLSSSKGSAVGSWLWILLLASQAPRLVTFATTGPKDVSEVRRQPLPDEVDSPAPPPPPPPAATRGAVARACLETTLILGGLGAGARLGLHAAAATGLVPPGWDLTSTLPFWPVAEAAVLSPGAALALGAGAGLLVTAARAGLLATNAWPEFTASTDRSNRQVLPRLTDADLLWVAILPAWSEELVFRGVLQPALGNGWLGLCGAAAVFGALHNSGGRTAAFSVWATAVGALYGLVAL